MKTIKYLSASLLSLSLIACGGGGGSSETPVQPPAAPSNFTATAGNASANVSWTQVSGTTYTLYYATAANISPSNCSTTPSCVKIDNADPRTITGLTNGTPYYFVATASKDGQTSDPTATRMVTPVAPAVAAPTGFVATPGNGGVSLNWDVLPSTTYTVYYATSNTLTPANCATLTGCVTRANATPGQIASLTNGTPYYFIITATQSGTTSPASTPVSVIPVPAAVPAPTGVAATAGNAQATVSWNNVAGNTYNLYRATSASLTPANCATLAGCVKTTGVTTPSTVTGLTNGTTYYFVVTANNSGIESPTSSVVNALPAAPLVVNAPTGVAATAGNAQATVSWTQLANTTYTMYLSESATVSPSDYYNGQAGVWMLSGVTSPYTVPMLTNGKTYYFVLTATQQTTTSSPSTAVSATPVVPVQSDWVQATTNGTEADLKALLGLPSSAMLSNFKLAGSPSRLVLGVTYPSAQGSRIGLFESTDGVAWRQRALPITLPAISLYNDKPYFSDIKYVNGQFVAVAYINNLAPYTFVFKSVDGLTWSNVDLGAVSKCGSDYNDGCREIVATTNKIMITSAYGSTMVADANLMNWQSATIPSPVGTTGSKFVVYGTSYGNQDYRVRSSSDGVNWNTTSYNPIRLLTANAWFLVGSNMLILGSDPIGPVRCTAPLASLANLTCTNNVNLPSGVGTFDFATPSRMYYDGAVLIAANSSVAYRSLDKGVTWTQMSVNGERANPEIASGSIVKSFGKIFALNLNYYSYLQSGTLHYLR